MKEIEISWLTTENKLNEAYSSGFQFSLFNKELRQCMPWMFCKDYIQDYFQSQLHNKTVGIYGYHADPKTDEKYDFDALRILFTNQKNDKLSDVAENIIKFAADTQKQFRIKGKVESFKVVNAPDKYSKCGVFALILSKEWLIAPPMISLITLLIRSGADFNGSFKDTVNGVSAGRLKSQQSYDSGYLNSSKASIRDLIAKGYKNFFLPKIEDNYPKSVDTHNMHSRSGIVALASKSTIVPHWVRPELSNLPDIVDFSF